MIRKITLNIDEELIQIAKKYAQVNNTTVSIIVTDYLRTLDTGVTLTPYHKLSPRLKKLAGAFKVPEDVKSIYYAQMEKKHSKKNK